MGELTTYLAQLILPGVALAIALLLWARRRGKSVGAVAVLAAMSVAMFIDIGADFSVQAQRWHWMPILLAALAVMQFAAQGWAAPCGQRAVGRVWILALALGLVCATLLAIPAASLPARGSTFLATFIVAAAMSQFDRRFSWATGVATATALGGLTALLINSGATTMAAGCAVGAMVSLVAVAMGDHSRAAVGPMALGSALLILAHCGSEYDQSDVGPLPWIAVAVAVMALAIARQPGRDSISTASAVRRCLLVLAVVSLAMLLAFWPIGNADTQRAPGDPMDGIYGK